MQHRLDSKTHRITSSLTSPVTKLLIVMALLVGGCAMNETQQRTSTGAAVGALGGALLGTSRQSAAIGAAVGAAGGFLYDQVNKRETTQTENERLRQENERLRQQGTQ